MAVDLGEAQDGDGVGFSYRKSYKAGPFRVAASKSGVSYSVGGKGMRVTRRADRRVQTTVSAPGTGLRYTAAAGTRHKTTQPAARRRSTQGRAVQAPHPVMRGEPARPGEGGKTPTGRWYLVVTLLSVGVLIWIPFAHAASRLGRRDLRVRSFVYGLAAILLIALSAATPTDAHGNPAGASGRTLSTIVGVLAMAVVAVGWYQLMAVRRAVYGNPGQPQLSTAAADPAVASYLAARARRQEARALAENDPVMARDLGIGRPDLPGPYDDGGLVDLNSAPVSCIAAVCSIDAEVAERIAATRQHLGSFSSLTELFAFADIDESTAARIREHGVLIAG